MVPLHVDDRVHSTQSDLAAVSPLEMHRQIWQLAWPAVITMLLQMSGGFIDMYFLGKLGPAALAAAGIANQLLMILFSLITSISVGTTALVARFIGAQSLAEARQAARQSVVLGALGSVVSACFLFPTVPYFLRLLGAHGEALRLGSQYLYWMLYGVVPYFLIVILTAIYRGLGDTRTPLLITMLFNGVMIVGEYFLIFGNGPFPKMGIAGAGLSALVARLLGITLSWYFLSRSSLKLTVKGPWAVDWIWMKRILAVGLPAAVQGLIRNTASSTYYGILGRVPNATAAVAALTVGIRAEGIAYMPGFAFSIAATALVGQSLGAKNPGQAERSGWASALQGCAVMTVMGLIFYIFAEPIVRLFTDSPEVVALAADYLRYQAYSEPFLGLGMILTGALQGAGETRWPTILTFVTMWLIRVPATNALALHMGYGATGAWITMMGSTAVSGVLVALLFYMGRWKQIKI
ncbi:MAG: MATE family efflux transporter [Armatimonadetes bacterium]|nr:MATE family efflux transporter [Armatimonadota bacterium]